MMLYELISCGIYSYRTKKERQCMMISIPRDTTIVQITMKQSKEKERERDYDISSSSRIPSAVYIIIVWLTCLFVFIGNILLRLVCIEIFQVDINQNIQIHASCLHNRRKEKKDL